MPHDTFYNLADDKRAHITQIAIEEFAENEFSVVSISQIVKKAGIAKGSFYQYFDGKEDLFLYLVMMAAGEKQKFFSTVREDESPKGMFETLRMLFIHSAEFQFSHPQLAKVASRVITDDLPAGSSPILIQIREQTQTFYRTLIEDGIKSGDVNPDIDVEIAQMVVSTIFNQLGEYILEKMNCQAEELQDLFFKEEYRQELANYYESVVSILQFGLGKKE